MRGLRHALRPQIPKLIKAHQHPATLPQHGYWRLLRSAFHGKLPPLSTCDPFQIYIFISYFIDKSVWAKRRPSAASRVESAELAVFFGRDFGRDRNVGELRAHCGRPGIEKSAINYFGPIRPSLPAVRSDDGRRCRTAAVLRLVVLRQCRRDINNENWRSAPSVHDANPSRRAPVPRSKTDWFNHSCRCSRSITDAAPSYRSHQSSGGPP